MAASGAIRVTARTVRKTGRMIAMKIKLDVGAKMPTRAHEWDAGLDLYARDYKVVGGMDSGVFDTGVHMEIPNGFVGFIKSKSGLNIMHGLRCEGVVDSGYTGSIVVKLYNDTVMPYRVLPGDKIAQLVILPVWFPENMTLVDELDETERGESGFGSTGR